MIGVGQVGIRAELERVKEEWQVMHLYLCSIYLFIRHLFSQLMCSPLDRGGDVKINEYS